MDQFIIFLNEERFFSYYSSRDHWASVANLDCNNYSKKEFVGAGNQAYAFITTNVGERTTFDFEF
ncbi:MULTISPECIES: hypothetical protein [unclassified Granulicatella]|uniref:hypothetical protein n=1 Tax=unclassified Granulicatella TaxID=2630493 RepID=UPI0010745DCD|nr:MULTISPECIES: hypothetical protein [unclassified Granulicatella]MBF0781027.1 hypothetical protein [Granulicatella sp. 19428wC4_WM01]TFU92567.1 hypothetical protein E4T68_07915 [Granulicatella sp. WM01]